MPVPTSTVCATAGCADHEAALPALDLRPDRFVALDPPVRHAAAPPPAPGQDPAQHRTVVVSAATLSDLRRVLPALDQLGSASRVVLLVLAEGGHQLAVPGQADPRAALVSATAEALPGSAGWRVDVRHSAPVPVSLVVGAAVHGTSARPWRAALGLRVGLTATVPGDWVPADPLARSVDVAAGAADEAADAGAVDVLLADDDVTDGSCVPTVTVPAPASWRELASADSARLRAAVLADERAVPPVDERVLNPTGFRAFGCQGLAELTGAPDRSGWVVRQDGRELLRLPTDGRVTDAGVRALRGLDAVHVRWDSSAGPVAAARTVVQLAACGVPLLSGAVPAWAVRLLGPALVTAVTSTTGWAPQEELRREEHSVRLRRAALAAHGSEARWRQLVAGRGVHVPPQRQVSVVLATRRPENVRFAVDQVRRQRGVALQLVLVLHGFSATCAQVRSAVRDLTFPFVVMERPADEVFGDVLNAGVRRCDGDVVAKMDDDDWYGPHHLADLAAAQRWSASEVVGSAADFVYLEPLNITLRRRFASEIYAEYVAGGTLVVDRAALLAAGGFRSMPRHVDARLLQDLRSLGGRVFRTHGLGYVLRRTAGGHTWSADLTYFLRDRGQQWRGFRPSEELRPEPAHVPVRAAGRSR